MKSTLVALSLFVFSSLWFPYGSFFAGNSGNPNRSQYAGQEDSTYDAKANPAQTNGTVSYDPMAPLPPVAPAQPSGSGMGR
jgi:hypothetical protein